MIRSQYGIETRYSAKDSDVFDLSRQIVKFLGIVHGFAVGSEGWVLTINTHDAPMFEKEVAQWREAARKLVIT